METHNSKLKRHFSNPNDIFWIQIAKLWTSNSFPVKVWITEFRVFISEFVVSVVLSFGRQRTSLLLVRPKILDIILSLVRPCSNWAWSREIPASHGGWHKYSCSACCLVCQPVSLSFCVKMPTRRCSWGTNRPSESRYPNRPYRPMADVLFYPFPKPKILVVVDLYECPCQLFSPVSMYFIHRRRKRGQTLCNIRAVDIFLEEGRTGTLWCTFLTVFSFYHAMHYSTKRGIAIACRLGLSVCLSVRPSVCDVGGSWPHRLKILETNCTIN